MVKAIEFNKERTNRYLKAMSKFPLARISELEGMDIKKLSSNKEINIVDLGAGEGYLTKYLSKMFPKSKIYAVDDSKFMLSNIPKIKNITLKNTETWNLPFKENSINLVFSLACFHHIKNKEKTFKEVKRVLDKKGYFIIGDVHDKTNVQKFFDDVVREYCITKHNLPFLNLNKVKQLAKKSELNIIDYKIKDTPWIFKNEENMIEFVKNILGLNITDNLLKEKITKYFSINKKKNKVTLSWRLGYYTLKKNENKKNS